MPPDLVIIGREELRALIRQEVAEGVRLALAEMRHQEPAPPVEAPKWASNSEALARSLGMCRTRVFDLLRTYPQLRALQQGRRWPVDEVRRALDALREAG